MASRAFQTDSPEATRELAAALGRRLRGGTLVLLEGPLGAGKTTFAQGLARGMGAVGRVVSPSFTLMREYRTAGQASFVHADLYRLAAGAEVLDLALDEVLDGDAVLAVEWPDRAGPLAAADVVRVQLEATDGSRLITLTAAGRSADAVTALLVPPGVLET